MIHENFKKIKFKGKGYEVGICQLYTQYISDYIGIKNNI